MSWYHLFLPHKDTHEKSELLSWHAFGIYILIYILLQVSFSVISIAKPGVLGVSSEVDQNQLIELTNRERQKMGLPPLEENRLLTAAAQAKAANMFEEGYWAHFAPSGKTPWDFILKKGYKFSVAGENLAKNFHNSEDVVTAWMESPTHKENITNKKYQEIGIAVVEGVLNGQKTTLVVQMFGTSATGQYLAQDIPDTTTQTAGITNGLISEESINSLTKGEKITNRVIDPYQVSKLFGFSILGFVATLLIIDLVIIRRRGVSRLASHHVAHLAFISTAAYAMMLSAGGSIL